MKGYLCICASVLLSGVTMGKTIVLEDGVRLIHVENDSVPLVDVAVVVIGGSLLDPPGQEGLAQLCASTLLRGTKHRSYEEIIDEVSDLGAEIDVGARKEFISLAVTFMPRFKDKMAKIIQDILVNPAFPKEGFEQEKSLHLEKLKALQEQDEELAQYFFWRFLYRNHEMGRPTIGYTETIKRIKPRHCAEFHRRNVTKANVIVVMAGAISEEDAKGFAKVITKDLPKGKRVELSLKRPKKEEGTRVLIVDKPDRTQTQVIMGHVSLSFKDQDFFPFLVGNNAIGGQFSSRLMQEIREKRGLSYGVSSGILPGRDFGTFLVRFFPASKDTVQGIEIARSVLLDAKINGISEDELVFARDNLANQFPFRIETAKKRAMEMLLNELYGRPHDYVETYVEKVKSQTLEMVNQALKRQLDVDNMVIVVVGVAAELEQEFAKLGWVKEVVIQPYKKEKLVRSSKKEQTN